MLGVDIARNLVEAGNKRAREQGLTNCKFQEGDASNLHELVSDADPKNARAFHLLGVVSHQLGRSEAASLVGHAVTLDPDFADAHNDRGVILAANGLFADALPCFERAVALNPRYAELRNNLGRGFRSLGRLDEAVVQFKLVLKSTPNSPVAHFNLTSVFELAGDTLDAEKHYRSAISLRPDFVDAHIHLASLLQDTDRLPEALAHAERAVMLRSDSPGARNNLGNILRTLGRRENAVAQYEAALRIDPNFFMAHYNCGVALRGETRIAGAKAHFARAFALKPDFLEAALALCIAELPALYEKPSDIAERRDAYARNVNDNLADYLVPVNAGVLSVGVIMAVRTGPSNQSFGHQGSWRTRQCRNQCGGLQCDLPRHWPAYSQIDGAVGKPRDRELLRILSPDRRLFRRSGPLICKVCYQFYRLRRSRAGRSPRRLFTVVCGRSAFCLRRP